MRLIFRRRGRSTSAVCTAPAYGGAGNRRGAVAPALLEHDLHARGHRQGEQRPDDAEDGTEEEHDHEGEHRVQVDRLLEDLGVMMEFSACW